MSDRFFYPFFILLCAAIIVGALFAGGGLRADAPDIDPISDGFVLEGESLRRLVQPLGATVDFAADSEGNTAYAVLAAHMTREDAPPSAGIFAELSSVYEAAYGGRTITVTVRARQGQDNPSEQFSIAYYTAGVGSSQPQYYVLTEDFTDYSFTYRPRPPSGEPGSDYVGIWPDLTGLSKTMDVEKVSVFVLEESE